MIGFTKKIILLTTILIKIQFIKKNNKKKEYIISKFTSIGPTFIKFGQMLSARPDIVGINNVNDFSKIKDKIKQFSEKDIKKIFIKEFNKTPEELFKNFNYSSYSAASIAQIHRATTHENEEIAIKILRPKIKKTIKNDIKFLLFVAKAITTIFPKTKRLKLTETIKDFEKYITIETDLTIEASQASQLKNNLKNDNGIYIPNVHWKYVSQSIYAIEWIDGICISNIEEIKKAGLCCDKISANLAITFFNQAYRDGFFHGDLHPGNILVMPNCDIALIDFGKMGYLDNKTKLYIAKILYGFIKKDYYKIAKIHFDAGYIPKTESMDFFATACRSIGEPIIGKSLEEIQVSKLLIQLFKITDLFNMKTQVQLLLFQKNLILIESIGSTIYPKVNLWALAEPWIKKWTKKNVNIKNKAKNYIKEIKEEINGIKSLFEKAHIIMDKKINKKHMFYNNKIIILFIIIVVLLKFIKI